MHLFLDDSGAIIVLFMRFLTEDVCNMLIFTFSMNSYNSYVSLLLNLSLSLPPPPPLLLFLLLGSKHAYELISYAALRIYGIDV